MSKIYHADAHGEITIRRSKNLRGLLDHARRVGPPHSAAILRSDAPHAPQPYTLRLYYPNGDVGVALFADSDVAEEFLRSRRSWRNLNLAIHRSARRNYRSTEWLELTLNTREIKET